MKKQIPLFKVHMASSAAKKAAEVLESGYIGQGEKVEQFERHLKNYFDYDRILTLNSGTSALHLALHLLKKPSVKHEVFDGMGLKLKSN